MFKQYSPIVLSLIVVYSLAGRASGHFLWLNAEKAGDQRTAQLFFSESPHEQNYHLPDSIAEAQVFAVSSASKRIEVPLSRYDEENYVGLKGQMPAGEVTALETVCEYGLYAGSLLCYHAQHRFTNSAGKLPDVSPSKELLLEMIPQVISEGLQVTVLWQGKPLQDATVMFTDAEGGSFEETTDEQGKVHFETSASGTIGLMTSFIEKDKNGELAGKKYTDKAHYATLTFEFDSNVSPAAEAKQSQTKRPNRPEGAFGPQLPEAISSFGGAVHQGNLYVYGGHTGKEHQHSRDNLSPNFVRLSLSQPQQWEHLSMGTPLQGMALVSCGDALYRVGGLSARNARNEKEDLHSVAEFSQFDPKTSTWTTFPDLPQPRSSHDAIAMGDKIYVAGGWALDGDRNGKWQKSALVYDTSVGKLGSWQELPVPPFQRRALAMAAWKDRIWVIGGLDDLREVQRTVFCFDPHTNVWSETEKIPGDEMQGFGVSAWGSVSGLYVSGSDGALYRLIDPQGSWEVVDKFGTPRFFHRLLPGNENTLLAVGGASMERHLDYLESIEIP